jgi:transcriptional regulator with XRE-family HTH domain
MKNLDDVMSMLPPERRAKVEEHAAALIAEKMTLRDLRKARGLTQERMAELLGVGQDNISRRESQADMLLSTLRSYVNAMGGTLDLLVRFPDRPAVSLPALFGTEKGDNAASRKPSRGLAKRARSSARRMQ